MSSRIALITGASSGIGEATAKRYAASGAHVALLARNAERLEAVAAAIRRDGGSATPFIADLADAAAVAEVSARIARDLGTPDILINNAGAGRWLPLIETSAAEASAMIAVPYLAAFNLTRAFLPGMLERRSGAIAFVTSPAAFLAWPNASGYIAARRAVAGLADALRAEVKGSGVTVTLIVLGTVDSPYWEHNPGSREHLPGQQPRHAADAHHPRGRRGDLCRRRKRRADGGQAIDLPRVVLAQCHSATPRRAATPPRRARSAGEPSC